MAIARDLSHLDQGWPPDEQPRFVQLLAEKWAKENVEQGPKKHAIEGTRFRHSDAGGCARKLAYKGAGIEPTNGMDLQGSWTVGLGTLIHDAWQEALRERYPDAEIEITCQAFEDGSGHIDALIKDEGKVISFELKGEGDYPYRKAIGEVQRSQDPAEGPKREHVIQASLNALSHDADEAVIGYLAKSPVGSIRRAKSDLVGMGAEWTLPRDLYEPIAREEIARVEGILALLDKGELAARKVPGSPGEIVDPKTSRWEVKDQDGMTVDTGSVWYGKFCNYCSHQDLCVKTQPGRIPVDMVVSLRSTM